MFHWKVPTRWSPSIPNERRPLASLAARFPSSAYVWLRVPSAVAVTTSESACTVVPCFISAPMVSGKSCMVLRIVLASVSSRCLPSLSYQPRDIQTRLLGSPPCVHADSAASTA